MYTRLMLAIGLAVFLILALCAALVGQAVSTLGYTLTTGDGLTLTLSADGQVTSLQIDGDELVSDPAPALLLRDLSDAGNVTAPNLLVNPGFEDGLVGWTEVLSNGQIAVAVVSQISRHGPMSQVLELSLEGQPGRGSIAYGSDPVPVEPGRRYRLSAWAKSKQGYVSRLAGNAPTMQMRLYREMTPNPNGIYVQWLDSNLQPLGEPAVAAPLVQNAQSWRLLRGEVEIPEDAAGVQVALVASLQDEETLWFDDVHLIQSPEEEDPLGGEVSWAGDNHLSQTVTAHDLQISVDYVTHDEFIAIAGIVQNLRDEDRAFDLTVSLPVEAAGWRFWDDVRHSRAITTGVYDQGISAVSDGWLPISLYPYAGIEDGERGIAIAQNPQSPQLVWLRYDARARALQATFHFGISPQATKPQVQNRATFDLRVFRFDPRWGFRDLIARYGDFFPQVQRTEFPFANYSDGMTGTIYRDDPDLMEAMRELQQQGVFLAEYAMTELWFPTFPITEHSARPTLPEILDVVDAFALPLSELWEESPALSESAEWDDKAKGELAKAIYHSAVVADNGEWKLKAVSEKAYPEEHWYTMWGANMDPDLAQGLGRWTLLRRVDPVFDLTERYDVRLDGVMLDNFVAFPVIDQRPAAIVNADYPLTYSPVSYKPGVHNGFAMFEFLELLRERLDQRGGPRAITVNCWGIGHPNYLARFIDYFGGEGNFDAGSAEGDNWNPEILDYRRALAGSKPLGFQSFARDVSVETALEFAALARFYGVNISIQEEGESSWSPDARDVVSATAAFVRQYALAGWEPLTYARADSEDVWLERFGKIPNAGLDFGFWPLDFYFPIHNRTDLTRTTTITIETTSLGLTDPASATITDLATDQTVPFSVVEGNIVVILTVGPRDTRVLQVSGGVAPPTPTPTPTRTTTPTATSTPCVLFGDLDGDGDVDIADIMLVASHWRCECGDDCYDPLYDLDDNCDIDIVDIMLVAVHWGETCDQ